MAKKITGELVLKITVDTEAWELSYGTADELADLKADIMGHVSDTVQFAVEQQFDLQANGSSLVTLRWQ